ncbi:MAG: cation-translocating P-type ATPase [Actinomycetota bacterium]|nr:cation-translocating P-type ATPase [Actinomycetota bacterium]
MSHPTVAQPPAAYDLAVEGMTCASCVRRVERALSSVDGVAGARVNLATESATVELAEGHEVDRQALEAAVEAAGYHATLSLAVADPAEEAAGRRARRAADLRRRRVRLAVGTVGSAAVLVLAYGFGVDSWSPYAQLALGLPVFAWVGADFHRGALSSLRHRSANMDTLVSLGSAVAFSYSVAATVLLPGKPTYFDVAAVIVTLISVGKYLEVLTRRRAGEAIESLASLTPRVAHLVARSGWAGAAGSPAGSEVAPEAETVEVAVETLRAGDVVLVRPGEALPADGVVISGSSALDESMLSGESVPVTKTAGDEVTGGTLNGLSPLEVEVTRAGADSTLAQVMALVERAQAEKSKAQRLADRVSSVFVPTILAVAALTFAGWLASGHSLVAALVPAVAVLVVACPCALGLATPVAVMVGSGRGAELGLLISGGEVLERVRRLDTVVVDKTGTLTLGRPEVVEVVDLDLDLDLDVDADGDEDREGNVDHDDGSEAVLALAAAAETASEHPLARAVQAAAKRSGAAQGDLVASTAEVTPGAGVTATVDGHLVQVGSLEWATRPGGAATTPPGGAATDLPGRANAGCAGSTTPRTGGAERARPGEDGRRASEAAGDAGRRANEAARAEGDRLAARHLTPVVIAIDGRARLVLGITDPLRPDAAAGVRRLKTEGLRVVLATGDRVEVAEAVGAEAGVDEVLAGLRPEDKAALVRHLQETSGPVAMVGDGINDAPALAGADVGIAIGTGTGVAMAAAEITLVHGDIGAVADAIALSRATRRVIWQNLGWAFGYNLVLVPLAAVGVLPPMIAAAAMATSSVSVVTNALRLRRFGSSADRTGPPAGPAGHDGSPAVAVP